jgi:hypothetical protein
VQGRLPKSRYSLDHRESSLLGLLFLVLLNYEFSRRLYISQLLDNWKHRWILGVEFLSFGFRMLLLFFTAFLETVEMDK